MVESICSFEIDDEPDFYQILGCDESSNVEQIITEYKLRALKEHPDKNDGNFSDENFKKLQQAKEILTDPEKRADYDKWRRSGLAITYKQWRGFGEAAQRTMHWASKPKSKPMIGPAAEEEKKSEAAETAGDTHNHIVGGVVWDRQQGSELLRKFRNYEI